MSTSNWLPVVGASAGGVVAAALILLLLKLRRSKLAFLWRMKQVANVDNKMLDAVLGSWTKKRQTRRLGRELADALPMLVRRTRSGRVPLEVIQFAARKAEGKLLCAVFEKVLDRFSVGVSLEEGLRSAYEDYPHPLFYRFISALQFSREVGGDPVHGLAALQEIDRRRRQLAAQITEESAEAKFSALLVAGLPVFVCIYALRVHPEMLHPLFHTSAGRLAMVYAVCSWLLGLGYLQWTLASMREEW